MLPIPLHRVRRRDRGFNQAAVIARELAQQWNLTMDESLLKRKKYTKTQTTLTIQERQENMYMAFQTAKNTPKAVILVDDVLTQPDQLPMPAHPDCGRMAAIGWE